jgi:hypothetical protein
MKHEPDCDQKGQEKGSTEPQATSQDQRQGAH